MCRYMGGKGKIGKHIAKRIEEIEQQMPLETDTYMEPFIGSLFIPTIEYNTDYKVVKTAFKY